MDCASRTGSGAISTAGAVGDSESGAATPDATSTTGGGSTESPDTSATGAKSTDGTTGVTGVTSSSGTAAAGSDSDGSSESALVGDSVSELVTTAADCKYIKHKT